jgi:hypothetical protein
MNVRYRTVVFDENHDYCDVSHFVLSVFDTTFHREQTRPDGAVYY